jgi:kumamolisin
MTRHQITGSERTPLAGAHAAGAADPQERMEVTLLLRRRGEDELAARIGRVARGDAGLPPMTRADFAANHGARADDIAAVERFAASQHLAVVAKDAARRTVILSGTVADFTAAFSVDLQHYVYDEGSYRGRTGPVHVPGELADAVVAVLGLDNRPQAKPHFRRKPGVAPRAAAEAAPVSYKPTTVAALYGFPPGTGKGQTIGIIELGGGSRKADLTTYFTGLGITPPKLVSVSVDHARNHATGSGNGPDGEVMLDIEVAGAVAPDATLVVYYAPNTDAGFLDAVTTAVHDRVHAPSVISISWGGPESTWTQQSLTAFDQAFAEAAALGITICVACGDNGSSDGVTGGGDHVDFPASSPHALACGGTSLRSTGQAIASETVWNDGAGGGATGGGVSAVFPAPSWQAGLSAIKTNGGKVALTMRGVPDVAGNADPDTGYDVRVDGQNTVIGGTSAVAPLWAGLIARLNEASGQSAGLLNPKLYANAAAFNDITSGNNGDFAAAQSWDACTGLGSPNGATLAALFGAAKTPAGV